MIRLGALVMVYVVGAVVAIVLLQSVLGDLNRAAAESAESAEAIDTLDITVLTAREALEQTDLQQGDHRRVILDAGNDVRDAFDRVAHHPIASGAGEACRRRIESMLPGIAPREEWLDEQGLESWRVNAPGFADQLTAEIAHLRQLNRGESSNQQRDLTHRLRNLIVGLTVAALVALNVTIILLLNTGEMIVRPVEALVEHSRELARERFGHKVDTPGIREFGELADSYNSLSEQLRLNEQRKMETLQQLGVSLNHELNNVINIIELQLVSLDRHAKGDEALKKKLVQIHENLRRIADTVASLKDVRRVVVTEYADGMMMLDLPGCTHPSGPEGAAEPGTQAGPSSEAGAP